MRLDVTLCGNCKYYTVEPHLSEPHRGQTIGLDKGGVRIHKLTEIHGQVGEEMGDN